MYLVPIAHKYANCSCKTFENDISKRQRPNSYVSSTFNGHITICKAFTAIETFVFICMGRFMVEQTVKWEANRRKKAERFHFADSKLELIKLFVFERMRFGQYVATHLCDSKWWAYANRCRKERRHTSDEYTEIGFQSKKKRDISSSNLVVSKPKTTKSIKDKK